jgi:hypothetical protein
LNVNYEFSFCGRNFRLIKNGELGDDHGMGESELELIQRYCHKSTAKLVEGAAGRGSGNAKD